MARKNNQTIAIVAVLLVAFVLVGGLNFLGFGSFTFLEQQPQITTQNNLTLKLDQKSFLPNVPITGTLDGTMESVQCGVPNRSPSKDLEGRYSLTFKINDVIVREFSMDNGYPMIYPVNGNPSPFITRIGALGVGLGFVDSCGHPVSSYQGVDFSVAVPQELKETGGNFDFKVFTNQSALTVRANPCPPNTIDHSDYSWGRNCLVSVDPPVPTLEVISNVYIEPAKCVDPNYVDYLQVFKQGTTVRMTAQNANEVSLPANAILCHSAPILKQYSDSNQTFEQSNVEYDSLRNGGYITVPQGQQWLFFYRGLPNISGVLQCETGGGVWDATNNLCSLPPTIVFTCNGVQTTSNVCIVQANDYRCQDPLAVLELLEDGSSVCRKYIDVTDTSFSCPASSELKTKADGTKFCEYQPILVCNGGTLVNGKCTIEAPPVVGGVGGIGSAIDPTLLIGLVLLVGGGLVWFFFIRKKR